MEENVALDSSKQKQFVKSIKGIKKIIKGKKTQKSNKEDKDHVKIGKVQKPTRKERGLVYLSHIPHGFYEHQMTEYFKQFGVVTNARVIRSKRTGMSKGHAFVEFKDPNVAQIVAETMNNYLMGKRLIKAALIPPKKQRKFAKRKHWNAQNNPGNDLRQKMKKAHNSIKDEGEELKIARRLLSNLNKTKMKLKELGIDYDFFTPVDVPESLLSLVEVKKEEDVDTAVVKIENKGSNKIKKEETLSNDDKKSKGKKSNKTEAKAQDETILKEAGNSVAKNSKKSKKLQQSTLNEKTNITKAPSKNNNKDMKVSDTGKNAAKNKESIKANKAKTQKLMLKNTDSEIPKGFMKIQKESDDDSGSSKDIDTDVIDKVMEQGESDDESETDEELDEDITSDEDESAEDESSPPKKVKNAPALKIPGKQNKKQGKKVKGNRPPVKQPMPSLVQKESKPSKKPKFEKKGNKTLNKVIKKKK